jgi:hypothetical protein
MCIIFKMRQNFYLILVLLFSSLKGFPQSGEDTTFLRAANENVIQRYQRAIGMQARLYNCSKYLPPEQTLEQHPYFLSEDWIMGNVFYDGEYFQNVPLMYDLSIGQLITEHYSSGHAMQLVEEKLEHFFISGHLFEKIQNDSVCGSLPQTGFYDVLHPGVTKVVAKRQKLLREQIVSTIIERSFDERNRYFVFRKGVFFPVKSKASVVKLMADKKQQVKKFLKKQNVSFPDNRELVLKKLAEYYDTLK